MKILVVGNVIKDVYLSIDPRGNTFEVDEDNIPWMNMAFDGSHHSYIKRTPVNSGVAITQEVINKCGHEALCYAEEDSSSYRYILSTDTNKVNYLVSNQFTPTEFITPEEPVDWIFVDRSAVITEKLVDNIKKYLSANKNVKLALFIELAEHSGTNKYTVLSPSITTLIDSSNIVFTNDNITHTKAQVWRITKETISLNGFQVHYHVENQDLLTHLTSYSIISATLLSYLISNEGLITSDESKIQKNKDNFVKLLQLAEINVENSTLNETLSKTKMEEKMEEINQKRQNLKLIAKEMVARPKGILAADESGGSIHKKFEGAGIPDDFEHRRDYRNIFFTTPGLADYVNGVILFDETARQKSDDGRDFVSYLTSLGIIPGIKVDTGLVNFEDGEHNDEKYTSGLDGLPERLNEYYDMGARFAKWRAAFEVTTKDGQIVTPSEFAIRKNVEILAQYAADCQEAGIVPIVEPEVVHDGDYSIDTCAKITSFILDCLFDALKKADVDLGGTVLKVNMVLAGAKFATGESTPAEVGTTTAIVLKEHVPSELAGVVFLSGGQTVEQATDNLREVIKNGPFPWPVTFSFARALQSPALDAWKGDNKNADAARQAFKERLIANCESLKG